MSSSHFKQPAIFLAHKSEKKTEQHDLLLQRMPAHHVSYLARHYIITKFPDRSLWSSILAKLTEISDANSTLNLLDSYEAKIDKISAAIKSYSPKIKSHDARKVAVLMEIYLKAEKYLNIDPATGSEKKQIAFNQLNDEIEKVHQDLINDLDSKVRLKKYGSPGQYILTLAAIIKVLKIPVNLTVENQELSTLHVKTNEEMKQNNASKAEVITIEDLYSQAKKAITDENENKMMTHNLYLLADFNPFRSSTLIDKINTLVNANKDSFDVKEQAKNVLINRIQHIYQPRLLNKIEASLENLKKSTHVKDKKHSEATVELETAAVVELENYIKDIEELKKNDAEGNHSHKISLALASSKENIIDLIKKCLSDPEKNSLMLKNLLKLMNLADLSLENIVAELNVKQARELTHLYIDLYSDTDKGKEEIVKLLGLESQKNPEKYTAICLTILSNKKIRPTLLSEEHKEHYQAVINTATQEFKNAKNVAPSLAIFENWTMEDFETSLQRLESPVSNWLKLGMAIQNAPTNSIKDFINTLQINQFNLDTLKLLNKEHRIALLNNLGSWEKTGKKVLSAFGHDINGMKNVMQALTHDFVESDLKKATSDTFLMAAFNEKLMGPIITILNTEETPEKRKLAWQIIEELDHGVWNEKENTKLHEKLHEQNPIYAAARKVLFVPTLITQAFMTYLNVSFAKPITESSINISDDSELHRIMKPAVYHRTNEDAYTFDTNNKLVRREIEVNKAAFFADANPESTGAALDNPQIATGLAQTAQLTAVSKNEAEGGFFPSDLLKRYRIQTTDEDKKLALAQAKMNIETFFNIPRSASQLQEQKPAIIELYKLLYHYNINNIKNESFHGDSMMTILNRDRSPYSWSNKDFIESLKMELIFSTPGLLEKFLGLRKSEILHDSRLRTLVTSVALGGLAFATGLSIAYLAGFAFGSMVAGVIIAVGGMTGAYKLSQRGFNSTLLSEEQDQADYNTLVSGILFLQKNPNELNATLVALSRSREMRLNLAKTIQYHQDRDRHDSVRDIFKNEDITNEMKDTLRLIIDTTYYRENEDWAVFINLISLFSPVRKAWRLNNMFNEAGKGTFKVPAEVKHREIKLPVAKPVEIKHIQLPSPPIPVAQPVKAAEAEAETKSQPASPIPSLPAQIAATPKSQSYFSAVFSRLSNWLPAAPDTKSYSKKTERKGHDHKRGPM